MSISAEGRTAPAPPEHLLGPPLADRAARLRLIGALVAALLLHLLVAAVFLIGLPQPVPEREPPTIPVEIVRLEPKPPPPKAAAPQPPTPPQPTPQQRHRESGGDPELTPGKVPEAPPQPKPEPQPPVAAETPPPKPEEPAEAVKLPGPEAAPTPPLPVPPPPHEHAKPHPALAAVPPHTQPAAPQAPSESEEHGKGGGDRYLNKLRDQILGNLIYPGSARSQNLAGVARFELVIDRQGRLLGLHLVHSSGVDVLDRAGRSAVELSAPFGPPPADVLGDQIGLMLTLYIGPDANGVQ